MSAEPTVTKCGFCGRLYKFYPFLASDQSACPSCVAEAERNSNCGKSTVTTTLIEDLLTPKENAQ